MHTINPSLKPFLRLLELVLVVFVIYKLADYSIEAEQAAMAEHTGWREQLGIGIAQTFLAAFVILIYFLFWNARIIDAIREEKHQAARFLNIGLLGLLPGLIVLSLLYWKIEKEVVKSKAKTYLVPVAYREIFRTPNNLTIIRGFRPTPDSLLILTSKLELIDPNRRYRNEEDEVYQQNANQKPVENGEELFSLKNGQLSREDVQRGYYQFHKYYFLDRARCLQAFMDPENNRDVYRFDNCWHKPLPEPHLIGYSPVFRNNIINSELDRDLFFATGPLHPDSLTNSYFYIGRINDTTAKVYRLNLAKDRELVKEFKTGAANVKISATTQKIYLISRFRILEIKI